MKIIVCGGRDFTDYAFIFRALNRLHAKRPITHVIEGGQRTRDPHTREIIGGADYWGMRWAKRNGIPFETVKANWDRDGKAAGPIRNNKMAEMKPDLVVAFKGGTGTASMIEITKRAGIEVMEIA